MNGIGRNDKIKPGNCSLLTYANHMRANWIFTVSLFRKYYLAAILAYQLHMSEYGFLLLCYDCLVRTGILLLISVHLLTNSLCAFQSSPPKSFSHTQFHYKILLSSDENKKKKRVNKRDIQRARKKR